MNGTVALLRRVLAEKRVAVALVALGLAADAGLYTLAVYPASVEVEDAGRRAAAAAANLEAARRGFESARLAADAMTRADAELRTFHEEILPRDLAGARALTFARLAALAADHGLLMERRASAPDREEGSHLARLQVSMLLSGAYRGDIRRFIHALETAPEFVVIEEIVLSRGDETEAGEVLSMVLSTYYRDDDHSQRVER